MKIVVAEPLHVSDGELDEDIRRTLPGDVQVVRYQDRPADDAEYARRVRDADVIVIANMPLRQNILQQCDHLRMVSIGFVGYDHVDVDYCHGHGIMVANSPTYPTQAVAELAIGLTLSLLRDLITADHSVRSGGTAVGLTGAQIAGRVFGVIGTGRIGQATAALARAFGATTIGFNHSGHPVDGIKIVGLDELLHRSDIVSVHVPLTPHTEHLIDGQRLAQMKPGALLINTARGPVVDNDALARALSDGTIAGAGLDVFKTEPPLPADTPILHAPHTVLTPHIGFDTTEALSFRARQVLGNIASWLHNKPEHTV